jgi:hypothetical protein
MRRDAERTRARHNLHAAARCWASREERLDYLAASAAYVGFTATE